MQALLSSQDWARQNLHKPGITRQEMRALYGQIRGQENYDGWDNTKNFLKDGVTNIIGSMYGNLWITTKASGGMAGHRGLELIGAP